jgi:hypothetical protein
VSTTADHVFEVGGSIVLPRIRRVTVITRKPLRILTASEVRVHVHDAFATAIAVALVLFVITALASSSASSRFDAANERASNEFSAPPPFLIHRQFRTRRR